MPIQKTDIEDGPAPLYLRLAQAVETRIRSGEIAAGSRLPPHRDLAYQMGISVGSVARAYTTLAESGLVSGEVGRGTIVRDIGPDAAIGLATDQSRIDMRLIVPPPIEDVALIDELGPRTLTTIAKQWTLLDMRQFPGETGREQHRRAAADWLSRRGVAANPSNVLMTYGGQDGLSASLLALAGRSGAFFCEELTVSSLKNLASTLGQTMIPLKMDDLGVTPDALDQAARRHPTRVALLYPSLQIPTARRMTPERRQAIADIARKHDLTILESAGYSETVVGEPDDFSNYIPERSISVHSLSNTTLPGMRCGMLRAPPNHLARIGAARHATVLATSTLLAEVTTAWILGGGAERLLAGYRQTLARRHAVLARIMPEAAERTPIGSSFAWVTCQGHAPSDVAAAASLRRVEVLTSDRFVVPGADMPAAIRVSISTPKSDRDLELGLRVIREILD